MLRQHSTVLTGPTQLCVRLDAKARGILKAVTTVSVKQLEPRELLTWLSCVLVAAGPVCVDQEPLQGTVACGPSVVVL